MSDERHWSVIESKPTQKLVHGPVTEREQVDTREGTVVAEPGDYIIQERDGNCYPISPDKIAEYYRWLPGEDKPFPVGGVEPEGDE